MSVVWGLGIENETTFNFTDKNRISRQMTVREAPNNIRADDDSYWNKTDGWNRTKTDRNYFQIHGDGTVDGNTTHGGFEFQFTDSKALNQSPKKMVELLFEAVNDAAKLTKSSLPFVIPSPFGAQVGYNTNERGGRFGSYHLNMTMPYDKEKLSNEDYLENYRKKLFKGIKVVRAIQPLIIAMTGGSDFKSVGTPSRAEGSGRQAYLSYGNVGNVDLNDTTRGRGISFKESLWVNERADSTNFKYGNNNKPAFRKAILQTVSDDRTEGGEVGDICVKQYNNVDRRIRTIEWRFLDPFFIPNIYEILKVIVSSMEHGENVGDITDAKTSDAWNVAMQKVIEEGWNARLPKEYQIMLKDKLGLDISPKDNKRADLVFQEVALSIWNKNNRGFWVKTLFDEDIAPPKVLNLNRYNWDMQFRHKYENEGPFEKYINKFIATLKKIDTSRSDGWIKVTFDSSGKLTIRDILIDDERFGLDMATEDYEDILFLLERIGAVELKTDSSGLIQELKVVMSDPKDIMKKIDNLQTIDGIEETYFGREVAEAQVEAVRQEREYQEGTRVRVTATGTIDNSQLHIVRVAAQDETPLYYNIRDLQEIFTNASFLDETNQPYLIQIIPAKIKYGSLALMSFWERSGRNIKVYINAPMFEDEDIEMSVLINKMKSHFYSSSSVSRSSVFVSNLTVEEFFARLIQTANNLYNKNPTIKISLDKAGLETLKHYGVRIISLSRGKSYFIANKVKYAALKKRFGDKIQLIKYMPYQRGVFVQKQGNNFSLFMNNKQIDNIGGN